MKHCSPPVRQNAVYTRDAYRYKEESVQVGSCLTGGNNVAEAKNRKMQAVVIDDYMYIEYNGYYDNCFTILI